MKHPSRILFFTLAGVLLLTFGWFVLRPREPSYQGRTLTEWLDNLREYPFPEADMDAVNAIHHIGSNAVPTLLAFAEAPSDSSLKKSLIKWTRESPSISLPLSSQYDKHELAATGFRVLGSAGQSAVPELRRLLKNDDESVRTIAAACLGWIGPVAQSAVPDLIKEFDREKSSTNQVYVAAWALGLIGPSAQEAIPSLNSGLTNNVSCRISSQAALINLHATPIFPLVEQLKDTTNATQWYYAMMVVKECGTNALPAVPVFISALNCTNGNIQSLSLWALGWLHQKPEACIPALLPFLASKQDYLREGAINSLHRFGKDAKPAVPALLRCLTDETYAVRTLTTNALDDIDPEAAAKAGIK